MAATIPLWAIGVHITNITLTAQAVNTTTGALTDTTPAANFYGHTQEISIDSAFELENISAQNRPYKNMVPIEQGTTLKLVELEKSAGSNLAAAMAFGASIFKYVLARGGQTFTGYGRLGGYGMNSSGKGSIKASFSLEPIDVGTDAPITYAQ
jgi:hypothetical protein